MLRIILSLAIASAPFAVFAECDPAEVGYVATFKAKAGSEKELEAALTKLADTVRRVEEGIILYAPYRGTEGKYYMLERYANQAARQAHGTADEVRALFPTLGPHLDGQADIQPVTAVCGD